MMTIMTLQTKSLVSLALAVFALGLPCARAFGLGGNSHSQRISCFERIHTALHVSRDDNDDDDDDDEDILLKNEEEDWRSFRAKLVMGENRQSTSGAVTSERDTSGDNVDDNRLLEEDVDGIGALFADETTAPVSSTSTSSLIDAMTPLDPSQWAYESGTVIEQGSVILGGVDQDFGFGLQQQYFHKTLILILEHDPTFTRAIILNRPSDIMLDDDVNNVKWKVWFGGDVQGIDSLAPSIVCLHSLKQKRAVEASVPVMKDIQWTSFDSAQKLVKAGVAKQSDFWVFAGYAGWGPEQLMGELDRKSWYMVATDSQTLLKELSRQSVGFDPRDAGLETWNLLMSMIGKGETAKANTGTFDDLMLKEWAYEHLLSTDSGMLLQNDDSQKPPEGIASTQELQKTNPIDRLLKRVSAAAKGEDVTEGSLVRASSADRSPFLLQNQAFHKSVVLVIMDDDAVSVGVILNRPVAKAMGLQISDTDAGTSRLVEIPLRYGGSYSVKGNEPLLWLHCDPLLREAKIGSPFGTKMDGIWKCTASDMTEAVGKKLCNPENFMAVTGVSVWTKGEGGTARGIQGEVARGRFEVVPSSKTEDVWASLIKQEKLTYNNLDQHLEVAERAWAVGGGSGSDKQRSNDDLPPITGLGENYDEEDDSLVFKSDVKVSRLSDDALRNWLQVFFLGQGSYDNWKYGDT